jgi:hypothetical protein
MPSAPSRRWLAGLEAGGLLAIVAAGRLSGQAGALHRLPDPSYHVNYALSTFGKNCSVIGLATNVTLSPRDSAYRWVEAGRGVESTPGVTCWNATDPNVAFDEVGAPWLA